jgi:serine phosphatase RsbU (regulator of sigma subunit)
MPRTIRWKLILSISVPLLITYLGMLAWDYQRQRAAAMEQLQWAVLERAESTAAHLDARLASAVQLASSTATLLESRPSAAAAAEQVRLVLAGATRENPWVSSVMVQMEQPGRPGPLYVARRGTFRVTEVEEPGEALHALYARVKERGAGAWSQPHEDVARAAALTPSGSAGGRAGAARAAGDVCTYAVPVVIGEEFRGIVAVNVRLEELRQLRPPARGAGGIGGGMFRSPPALGPRRDRDRDGAPFGDGPRTEGPPAPTTRRAADRDAPRDSEQVAVRPPPAALPAPATMPSALDDPADPTQPLRDFAILSEGGYVIVAPKDAPEPPNESIFDVAARLGQHELADAARTALAGESRVVRVAGLHEVIGTVTTDEYHWIALAPIASTGWALVSVIPESETMAPILARIAHRGLFLLGGTLVLLLVVLAVSIRISRPIEQMAGAVDRLAAGDLDAQVTGITSRDELGRLAGGFNHMTRQLKAHVAALTEQTAAREKVDSELRIARQIQTDMLPRTFPPFPDRPEFDLHAVNLPARRVAGDFYDFFFTPSGLLTVVIADVSGKGVPAALLMAVTRTIVRNLGMSGLAPQQIAERANAMLIADTSRGMFVTMLICQYDPLTGRLAYVNAGHPPPLRLAPGGEPRPCCDVLSPLLGVDDTGEMGPYQQCEETLAPGESVFLYTDGVPDARAPDRAMFGEAALLEVLRRHAGLAPAPLIRAIADHLDQYQAGLRQDDITLLVLRRSAVTA